MKPILGSAFVLVVVAIVTVVAYFVGAEEEAIERAFALGFLTLVVVGGITILVVYARILTKSLNELDIAAEELSELEVVWAKSSGSMVHYKSGNALMFWAGVGGKLFLTNQVVEFRAHAGQPWVYRLTIPLHQIVRVRPFRLLGFVPGGMRIELEDGTAELFTFGAAFDLSREWADAIMAFRDDLEEDEDAK